MCLRHMVCSPRSCPSPSSILFHVIDLLSSCIMCVPKWFRGVALNFTVSEHFPVALRVGVCISSGCSQTYDM